MLESVFVCVCVFACKKVREREREREVERGDCVSSVNVQGVVAGITYRDAWNEFCGAIVACGQ